MRALRILLIAILVASTAWAAPSISSVSGTVSSGQSITISGSGFGSGPNVVIFDDFEKGSNGNTIASGAASAQVGEWSLVEGTPKYSNSAKVSGSLAFRADMSLGWMQRVTASLPTNTTKYFYSYWVYMPATDAWPGAGDSGGINWKFIWFTMDADLGGGFDHPVMLSEPYATGYSGFNCSGNPPTAVSAWLDGFNMSKGAWKRVWGYTDIATSGTIQLWDLTAGGVHTSSNQSLNTSSATYVNIVKLNGYGRQTSNCHPMFDDVYVATGDNARARVEIGNAATYTSCTNLTICTPSAWSGTSITATVRQGGFADGATAYLYVFDATGTANSTGKEITFGSTSGGSSVATAAGVTMSGGGTLR